MSNFQGFSILGTISYLKNFGYEKRGSSKNFSISKNRRKIASLLCSHKNNDSQQHSQLLQQWKEEKLLNLNWLNWKAFVRSFIQVSLPRSLFFSFLYFVGFFFDVYLRKENVQTIVLCTREAKVKSLIWKINNSLKTWKIFLITVKLIVFHPDSRHCFKKRTEITN